MLALRYSKRTPGIDRQTLELPRILHVEPEVRVELLDGALTGVLETVTESGTPLR